MDNPYQPPIDATSPPDRRAHDGGQWMAFGALLLLAIPVLFLGIEYIQDSGDVYTTGDVRYFHHPPRYLGTVGTWVLGILGNLTLWLALRTPYRPTWVFVTALGLGCAYLPKDEVRLLGFITLVGLIVMNRRKYWKV